MKELNIEEKARRYDEAIEIAKEINNEQRAQPFNIMTRVFPELRGSEDERIKKAIRNLILSIDQERLSILNITQSDVLAWLEKQCQNPIFITDEWIEDYWQHEKVNNPYSYNKGEEIQFDHQGFVRFCKKYCKNLIELPNGEDYGIDGLWHAIEILKKTLGNVDGYQTDDGILDHKCAISAVKNIYEQKPNLSEEDKKILNGVILDLTVLKDKANSKEGKAAYQREINLIKSLKERAMPQPKQKWSEEDERNLDWLITVCERIHYKSDPQVSPESALMLREWLKSLRPQNTWKPSDEQMKALKEACDEHWEPDGLDPLYTLYQDLKKLKGEEI